MTTFTTTINSLSMSDCQSHLLAFEKRLDDQIKTATEQPSGNVAKCSSSNYGCPHQRSNQQCSQQTHGFNRAARLAAKGNSQFNTPYYSSTNDGPR